ncbi:MAG TPA: hypothetical protein VMS17_26950 [Gemmataceae bacterium]|nr:hypothetical protein [Gemmataceae bacterium]
MARRTLNHKALRADYDAAERRKKEALGEGEDQADEQDEEESEDGAEAADVEAGEEEEAPKKKKKPAKEPKPKRTRTPKVVRQRVVWGVFNNSNARVQTFAYPQRKEADEYAAKMSADKGSTFFVQPIKEPIEEKKE